MMKNLEGEWRGLGDAADSILRCTSAVATRAQRGSLAGLVAFALPIYPQRSTKPTLAFPWPTELRTRCTIGQGQPDASATMA